MPSSSEKFLPTDEKKLLQRIEEIARALAAQPEEFAATPQEVQELSDAAEAFSRAFMAARHGGARSRIATAAKNNARDHAKRLVTRLRERVRHSDEISAVARVTLELRERGKARAAELPKAPPKLKFVRALHEGNGSTPMHELEFREFHSHSKSRPSGAVRLELFVDLIPPEEPIPNHPGAHQGGRAWYLRSYTRNPIVLAPPMPRVPMRVLYWGRWADSAGNVGPFSATAAGWIEGGSHRMLPGGQGMGYLNKEHPPLIEDASAAARSQRGTTYVVAVLEAQDQSYAPHALPEPAEPKRLEGPAESEAA